VCVCVCVYMYMYAGVDDFVKSLEVVLVRDERRKKFKRMRTKVRHVEYKHDQICDIYICTHNMYIYVHIYIHTHK